MRRDSINSFIDAALNEDIGENDHTSLACIKRTQSCKAKLVAKDKGIMAGVELAGMILRRANKNFKIKIYKKDGQPVKGGDVVFEVTGNSRALLKTERVLLNCMQRMSGIATKTNRLVNKVKGTHAKILDTRKTTPGFRMLEKWAVRTGGGYNHRYGLNDMFLVKDNHVDLAGGVAHAISGVRQYIKRNKKKLKVVIEVRNIRELKEVLQSGGIDRILLDNFTISGLKKAVRLINGKYETEASGGINESNISEYAKCGVDYISVGALTHSYKSLDLALKVMNP